MRKLLVQKAVIFVVAFLGTILCYSQNYKSHTVRKGETLASIAVSYGISQETLLRLNSEAAKGIEPGMVLIIAAADSNSPINESGKIEVERFVIHVVDRKETLFNLSKKYGITQDDIKRYNPELYKEPLKKNMRLRIPIYRKGGEQVKPKQHSKDTVGNESLVEYTVKPQETAWSIANRNGLTLNQLKAINPQLSAILKVGDVLYLPVSNADSQELSSDSAYINYEVKQYETVYSITRQFQISDTLLVRLNPKVSEGLKYGMVLRLPAPPKKEVNIDNYAFYEVKPKETIYSLTKKLKVTEQELNQLNPNLRDGLKTGTILKLPITRVGELNVYDALIIDKVNLLDSISVKSVVNIAIMLPFGIKEASRDSIERLQSRWIKRNVFSISLDFYTGAMAAIKTASKYGISVNASVFDTQNDLQIIDRIIRTHDFSNMDVVMGPLIPSNVEDVARKLQLDSVPVISPLSSNEVAALPNIFQAVPSESLQRQKMLNYMETFHKDKKVILIADSLHAKEKATIIKLFPKAIIKNPNKGNFLRPDDFFDLFPPPDEDEKDEMRNMELYENDDSKIKEEYWVWLETEDLGLISSATTVLSSFITKERRLVLCTSYRGNVYDNDNVSNYTLAKLSFHFPSPEKPLEQKDRAKWVEQYLNEYGVLPNKDVIKAYDTTLDAILRSSLSNYSFFESAALGQTQYFQNEFYYVRRPQGGFVNESINILKYEGLQLIEVQR